MNLPAENPTDAPRGAGSTGSRVLGALTAAALAALVVFGVVLSPPEVVMGDVVRVLYVHVPSAVTMYLAVGTLALASVLALAKRSEFWDVVASASAELSILFCGFTLLTGMLWGRPTWGTYWTWDPRLTTTALLMVLLCGYVALRRVPAGPDVRARRSAIAALVVIADVPIIKFSVDWWRGLHQTATLSTIDPEIDGLMLFSLLFGIVAFVLLFAWLLLLRFRVEWLARRAEDVGLDAALAARRAEALTGGAVS